MKGFLLIICVISCVSCASYYDDYANVYSKHFQLELGSNVNTYTALDWIPGRAGTEVWYPQKFVIDLPKLIKGFMISGNNNVFEYDNRQIISVNAGFSNKNLKPGVWRLAEPSENDLSGIKSYYKEKKYSDKIFDNEHNHRKIVMYTNGEVKIILFNVKQDNAEPFLATVKSFKYLD